MYVFYHPIAEWSDCWIASSVQWLLMKSQIRIMELGIGKVSNQMQQNVRTRGGNWLHWHLFNTEWG